MTQTPEIKNFVAMGRFLHGDKWKAPLAKDLGISVSYVSYMACDNPKTRKPISQKTYQKMVELVAKKLLTFDWDFDTDLEIRLRMEELENARITSN